MYLCMYLIALKYGWIINKLEIAQAPTNTQNYL
jgi:hypothetical protein